MSEVYIRKFKGKKEEIKLAPGDNIFFHSNEDDLLKVSFSNGIITVHSEGSLIVLPVADNSVRLKTK
jgi:hypothetical protein